ncbi:MAG: hypothetical protein GY795_19920 [Desulfobacterales bacterium]|nr:hypothetical protein [Desulfobacterales bacterium]
MKLEVPKENSPDHSVGYAQMKIRSAKIERSGFFAILHSAKKPLRSIFALLPIGDNI